MPQYGGAAEKCAVCSKTVYLAEKIVVEDKEDKKTFHKNCLKCSHCKVTLTLGNYASMQGIFYCKPHFKQLFATKGNYDEGFGKDKHTKNWSPATTATTPASFVPVDKDEPKESAKKETPSTIASKFGKGLNIEKCHVCHKTVYATEKTVVEDKEDKKVFHKTCLKCSHCNVIVTLGNYASMQGVVYCKPHFKQLFAQKGNYDEAFGKEKTTSKWEPQVNTAPSTFVPVDKDEVPKEKRPATEGVASRFKSTAANTEKCQACGKTVYATERIVVEDKEDKQTYHKTCLKCSHCSVVLTLGNYASMQGVTYCKPHFKQLFAHKGNFDESFGKEKHTKKWSEKDGAGDGETTPRTPRGTPIEEPHAFERETEREKQQQREREREREREEQQRAEREHEHHEDEYEHSHDHEHSRDHEHSHSHDHHHEDGDHEHHDHHHLEHELEDDIEQQED